MVQVVERTFYWVSRDSVKFVSLYDTSCICDQTLVLYGERNPRIWCWRCVCGEERACEGETTHCSLTCSVPVAAQLQPLVPAWQCARVFVCERVSPLCSPVCYSKTEDAASAPNQETHELCGVHTTVQPQNISTEVSSELLWAWSFFLLLKSLHKCDMWLCCCSSGDQQQFWWQGLDLSDSHSNHFSSIWHRQWMHLHTAVVSATAINRCVHHNKYIILGIRSVIINISFQKIL